MNISLLTTVLIAAGFTGRVPFSVLQLLWCNLVMDILGSIALCTEPYVEGKGGDADPNTSKRISRKDPIIDHVMWRNIFCQSVYQIIVMMVLIFAGPFMFYGEDSYNPLYAPPDP